ncbi:hypothetical protein OKW38_000150 [Paraburkholderia sp. MM5496-R1]
MLFSLEVMLPCIEPILNQLNVFNVQNSPPGTSALSGSKMTENLGGCISQMVVS